MQIQENTKWERASAIIVTNVNGQILSTQFDEKFTNTPEEGTQLEDFWPLFYGILPLRGDSLELPNIHILDGIFHVIIKKVESVCIISFYDVQDKVNKIEDDMHNIHQQAIGRILSNKNSYSDLSCDILVNLGFMSFVKEKENWRLIGNIPSWFYEIKPHYNLSSVYFDLAEIFPFLEIFLQQGISNNKISVSGFWIEESNKGEEFIFQASKVMSNKYEYVFIETLNERFVDNYNIIQLARDQKLNLEKLQKTEKELRKTIDFKQQFISIITHDIKSPMIGVYSLLDHLISDKEFTKNVSEEHQYFLQVMTEELQNIQGYVDTLYNWSLVQSDEIRLDTKVLNLVELFDIIMNRHRNQLLKKNITLTTDIPNHLSINVDGVFIKNAFSNLITNAIKFSNRGGEIQIVASQTEDKIIISFIDYGIGIHPDKMKNLFKSNKGEANAGTEGEKGIGIGMNIVKMIMDFHKAKIDVQSTLGKGTTVTLSFPKI
jgi:signal transduction histidine kinase